MKLRLYPILALFLGFLSPVLAQFILPEKDYTTQSDIDVIRVDSTPSAVTGLKAELVNPSVGEILINWHISQKPARLSVIRSDIPISTMQTLLESKTIAILDGGATVYRDIPEGAGNYYYAVVSRKAVEDQSVILTPGENYTLRPVTILSSDKKKFTSLSIVKSIRARFLDKHTIRVQWEYEPNPYVYFIVYRYTQPIDSSSVLEQAVRLGIVRGGKNYFDDTKPPVGQNLFYAVTTTDASEKENRHLAAGDSFTINGIIMQIGEIPTVRKIQAFRVQDQIQLSWESDVVSGDYEYIIYRSRRIMDNDEALKNATILAYVNSTKNNYIDSKVASGDYYYAIVTQNSRGELSKAFIPGGNVMINPAGNKQVQETPQDIPDKTPEVSPGKGASIFTELTAQAVNNTVVLTWSRGQAPLPVEEGMVKIYRFRQKPGEMRDVILGTPVGYLKPGSVTLEDKPPVSGLYYYAIFYETGKGLVPPAFTEYENLIGPVDFRGGRKGKKGQSAGIDPNEEPYLPDTESAMELPDYMVPDSEVRRSEAELNLVLKNTYLKKDYEAALRELAPFRHDKAKPIRAKAIFYSGMANYYIGDYRPALDQFLNPVVREVYGERADFWYRRTLESMEK